MLRNYLRVTLKNLLKTKINSVINVLGFAIGIACCIMILLYVRMELSYDAFHKDRDDLYRVEVMKDVNGLNRGNASINYGTADVLHDEYPEVLETGRLYKLFNQDPVVNINNESFVETQFFFAEQTILNILTIPFKHGKPDNALIAPNTLVLTEEAAQRYFGTSDVVGKTLTLNINAMDTDFKITGVLENCPANSHFQYSMLAQFDSFFPIMNQSFRGFIKSWYGLPFWTYVKLAPGTDPKAFETKMARIVSDYFPATRQDSRLYLRAVRDIHLHSNVDNELGVNNDIIYVYIFSAIALLVLFIACINFMNLTTARSINRAKEVGLRKVLGAHKRQLIGQFLFESVLTTAFAVVLAFGFVELCLGLLSDYTGIIIQSDYLNPGFILSAAALTLLVGGAAGLYPAFFLSSFQPVKTLKGVFARSAGGKGLRTILVVLQMSITVILLVGIFTITDQLDYIRNKNLGFQKEQVVLLKVTGTNLANNQRYETFKARLLQMADVKSITKNIQIPGHGAALRSVYFNEVTDDAKVALAYYNVGHDFAKTYNLDIIEGRDISPDFPSDTNRVYLVNEAAVKQYNLNPVIGREITTGDSDKSTGRIVGIVRDFHYSSLHETIGPLVIGLWNIPLTYVSMRMETGSLRDTVDGIETVWKEYEPNRAMEFFFLDDQLDSMYRFEATLSKIVTVFTGLAIFIACLGLFGMALYAAEQRTREIGIRKVLGASVQKIMVTFSLDFVKLMVIANIIAWPLAYLAMRRWLNDFHYRIDLGFEVFLLAGLLTLCIAVMTVSYQSIRAGLTDPIKTLRRD